MEGLGAVEDYDRLEAMAVTAVPFGDSVAYLRASGGGSFGALLPVYDTFTLGGPVSMPGFNIGELRGSNYWSAQASFLRRDRRHQLRVRPGAVRGTQFHGRGHR